MRLSPQVTRVVATSVNLVFLRLKLHNPKASSNSDFARPTWRSFAIHGMEIREEGGRVSNKYHQIFRQPHSILSTV